MERISYQSTVSTYLLASFPYSNKTELEPRRLHI